MPGKTIREIYGEILTEIPRIILGRSPGGIPGTPAKDSNKITAWIYGGILSQISEGLPIEIHEVGGIQSGINGIISTKF